MAQSVNKNNAGGLAFTVLAIFVLAAVAYIFLSYVKNPAGFFLNPNAPQSSSDPNAFVPPPSAPPPTALNTTAAESAKPFQAFVSYTDTGFFPNPLTITKGQTVRFTNNSHAPLHLNFSKTAPTLKPGDHWQYTFNTAGTVQISNTLDKTHTATVQVK